MAVLHNKHLRRRVMLRPVHTFGRHPASSRTVLQEADVSKLHAVVRWNGALWEICDQSRNGTYVNGARIDGADHRRVAVQLEVRRGPRGVAEQRRHRPGGRGRQPAPHEHPVRILVAGPADPAFAQTIVRWIRSAA